MNFNNTEVTVGIQSHYIQKYLNKHFSQITHKVMTNFQLKAKEDYKLSIYMYYFSSFVYYFYMCYHYKIYNFHFLWDSIHQELDLNQCI